MDPKTSVTGKIKQRYWYGRRKAEKGVSGGLTSDEGVLTSSSRVA
jgi:hypothetical protein